MVRIALDHQRIGEFCRKWKITEFALFGSVLRDDFRPDSDVDVLVRLAKDAHIGLREIFQLENELKDMFGREVDVVTRDSIELDENYIRRKHILNHMEVVHAG